MPLQEGAINEILSFASEGLVEAGDLLSLEEYSGHTMRLRGHMAGLALRELQNRATRQSAHMAAGLAQFIANRYAPGVLDDGDLDKIEEGLLRAITALMEPVIESAIAAAVPPPQEKYDLCEFYYFRHPTLKPGFQPAQGGLLANAATLHPEAWEYLQSVEGQKLCKTEAEWQALTTATWATLADGTKVGWNGIGGAPFYAPNTATGALRLPDLRGMYAEAAGFDALGVGGTHGDAVRRMQGMFNFAGSNDSWFFTIAHAPSITGVFAPNWQGHGYNISSGIFASDHPTGVLFDSARAMPPAAKNQPRAWGALACVYLGRQAS